MLLVSLLYGQSESFIMHISAIMKNDFSQSFKAGKTTFYTDFGGTYAPFAHNDICHVDSFHRADEFNSMYSGFNNFFSKFNDKLKLIVTTGRSKNEYDYFVKHVNDKKLNIYNPQELITRDGSNRYFVAGNKIEQDTLRNQKVQKNSNITNINLIRADVEKLIKSLCPDVVIVEAPVNKNKFEYGEKSLEHVLNQVDIKKRNNYVSIAQSEPLMLEIALSKKYNLQKLKEKTEKYFEQNNIKASVNAYENDKFLYLPIYEGDKTTYEPANTIIIKPMIEDEVISKLYDVKNEVKKNIKDGTDDLVVAAGDGSNDEEMLNPLNYLDLYGIEIDKNKNIEEILSDEKVLDALKRLPFFAIVCSNTDSLKHIRKMGEILDRKGIHKIIANDNPKKYLLKNVKQAIKTYGETNEEYMFSFGPDFYCSLCEH